MTVSKNLHSKPDLERRSAATERPPVPEGTATRQGAATRIDWDLVWERFGITAILLLVWIIAAAVTPRFAGIDNLTSILRQSAFVGIAAVGMTIAIISGTFDLSVGSTQAICAWVAVSLAKAAGVLPAFAAACAVGAMIGLLNGLLVAGIRIPAFIATLGTMFSLNGLLFVISGAQAARFSGRDFVWWGNGQLLGLPVPFLVFLAAAAAGALVLHRTTFGRFVFALGSNRSASRVAGVPVAQTTVGVFIAVGLFTALGAVLLGSRLYSAGPGLEPGFELNVIATVVLGGTRLAGGRGAILGTVSAAILFATLSNVLNLHHVDAFVQRVAVGLVLLLALSIEGIRQRLSK